MSKSVFKYYVFFNVSIVIGLLITINSVIIRFVKFGFQMRICFAMLSSANICIGHSYPWDLYVPITFTFDLQKIKPN